MLVIPLWEKSSIVTGNVKNLLLPCLPHNLIIATGNGDWPVANHLDDSAGGLPAQSSFVKWLIKPNCAHCKAKLTPHSNAPEMRFRRRFRMNPDTARQLIFNLSRYLATTLN